MSGRGEAVQDVREESLPVEEKEVQDEEAQGSDVESARETARRIFEELEAEDSEEAPSEGNEEDAEPVQSVEEGAPAEEEAQEEHYEVPQRFTAEEKEVFNQAPPKLKKALAAMVQNHERQFYKATEDLRIKEREASHVLEVVRPYLQSNPDLLKAGWTESKIVSALIGSHKRLTDPKTSQAEFVELGEQLGFDMSGFKGTAEQRPDDPEIRALREELKRVKSFISEQQNAKQQEALDYVKSQIKAAQEEKDAQGRYLYPKLHDLNFLQQIEPLVRTLRQSTPGLTMKDALIRAHLAVVGTTPGELVAQKPARLSENKSQKLERARAAVASARGRSQPTVVGDPGEIPEEALGSARDSARWALKQLRGGR